MPYIDNFKNLDALKILHLTIMDTWFLNPG